MPKKKKDREERRYAAVNAQITQQFDAATEDRSPAVALLRAWLSARLFIANEETHRRAEETTEE